MHVYTRKYMLVFIFYFYGNNIMGHKFKVLVLNNLQLEDGLEYVEFSAICKLISSFKLCFNVWLYGRFEQKWFLSDHLVILKLYWTNKFYLLY
jgi:hypothetical protein